MAVIRKVRGSPGGYLTCSIPRDVGITAGDMVEITKVSANSAAPRISALDKPKPPELTKPKPPGKKPGWWPPWPEMNPNAR